MTGRPETQVKLRGDVVTNIAEMQDLLEATLGVRLSKSQVIANAVKYALSNTSIPHRGKVS